MSGPPHRGWSSGSRATVWSARRYRRRPVCRPLNQVGSAPRRTQDPRSRLPPSKVRWPLLSVSLWLSWAPSPSSAVQRLSLVMVGLVPTIQRSPYSSLAVSDALDPRHEAEDDIVGAYR